MESHSKYPYWAAVLEGDPNSIVCTICKIILSARPGVLRSHAKSMRHFKNTQVLSADTTCNDTDYTDNRDCCLDLKVFNVMADPDKSCRVAVLSEDSVPTEQMSRTLHGGRNLVTDEGTAVSDGECIGVGSVVHSAAADSQKRTNKQRKTREDGCYVLGQSNWNRYRQKYRPQWETNPLFQGWIAPVEGDCYKARCLYCRVIMRAHFKDLKDHSTRTKHAMNVSFAAPFSSEDLADDATRAVSVKKLSRARTQPKKCSRFDKLVERKPLTVTNNVTVSYEEAGLLVPDDSLVSCDSLIALAINPSIYSLPENTTTLVMPGSVNLDEDIARSIPMTTVGDGPDGNRVLRVVKVGSGKDVTSNRNAIRATMETPTATADVPALVRLAQSVTLWEFLKLKYDRRLTWNGGSASVISSMLSELEALQRRLGQIAAEQLVFVSSSSSDSGCKQFDVGNTLVIQNEKTAQFLGIPSGKYFVRETEEQSAALAAKRQRRMRMREPAGQTVSRCGRTPRNTMTVFGRNASSADFAELDDFGRQHQSTERAERGDCRRIGGAVVFQNAMDCARIEYDDGVDIAMVTEQSGDDLDRGSADVHYQVFQEDASASEDAVAAASETAEGTFVYYVTQRPEQGKLEIVNDNTGYCSVVAVAVDGALVETSSDDHHQRLDQSLQFSNSLLGIQEPGTVEHGVTNFR